MNILKIFQIQHLRGLLWKEQNLQKIEKIKDCWMFKKILNGLENHQDNTNAVYNLKSQYIELNLRNMELKKSLVEFEDSKNKIYYDLYTHLL